MVEVVADVADAAVICVDVGAVGEGSGVGGDRQFWIPGGGGAWVVGTEEVPDVGWEEVDGEVVGGDVGGLGEEGGVGEGVGVVVVHLREEVVDFTAGDDGGAGVGDRVDREAEVEDGGLVGRLGGLEAFG